MANQEMFKDMQLTQNEQIVLQEIEKHWINIKENFIEVKELENWLVVSSKKWIVIRYFSLKNKIPESYLNIRDWLIKSPLFYDMIRYTWYRYIKNKLYKKEDIVLWRPKEWAKEIDIFSEEFFKVMDDTNFYIDSFYNNETIRRAEKWESWALSEEEMQLDFELWNFRLKDFLYLKKCKMIDDEMYMKYLPIMISKLEKQAWDTRYDVFKNEPKFRSVEIKWKELHSVEKAETDITEEEIKYYFENNFIDWNQAKKLLEIIKIKQNKEKEKKEIIKNSQSNLIQEKLEFNV